MVAGHPLPDRSSAELKYSISGFVSHIRPNVFFKQKPVHSQVHFTTGIKIMSEEINVINKYHKKPALWSQMCGVMSLLLFGTHLVHLKQSTLLLLIIESVN